MADLSSIEPPIDFARQTLGDLRGLWPSKFFLLPPVLPPTSFPNDRESLEPAMNRKAGEERLIRSVGDLKATVQDTGQQLKDFLKRHENKGTPEGPA